VLVSRRATMAGRETLYDAGGAGQPRRLRVAKNLTRGPARAVKGTDMEQHFKDLLKPAVLVFHKGPPAEVRGVHRAVYWASLLCDVVTEAAVVAWLLWAAVRWWRG
jgi:hypothetical protein